MTQNHDTIRAVSFVICCTPSDNVRRLFTVKQYLVWNVYWVLWCENGQMAYFLNVLESIWICNLFLLLQAIHTADPAHLLWRGCHGSALCHCWLNMEETPLSPYQTLKFSTGEKACSPPTHGTSHSSLLRDHTCLMISSSLSSSSCYTKTNIWQKNGTLWMDDWRSADRTFGWALYNVPDLNTKGIKEVLYGYLLPNCLKLLIRQSCCFAHTFTQVHLYLLNTTGIIGPLEGPPF